MDENKVKALGAALAQIEKQFGKGAIMKMGDAQIDQGIQAVSTGSLGLDMALGIGGLPRGRVVEIYGPESSGKTTLTLQVIAAAQRQAAALHKARLLVDEGRSESEAVESAFPRLHFSRKALVEAALRQAGTARLARTIAQLAEAAFDMRRQPALAEATAQRALLSIAVNARRRG